MNRIALITAGLAVLVLATGAVAAVPADAPVDVPADDHPAEDPAPVNQTDTNGTHMNDTHAQGEAQAADNPGQEHVQAQNENRSDAAGPPIEMPDPVPDKVSQIHEMVRGFIDGDVDGSLGDAISDFLGQDADAAGSPDDGSADSQSSQDA